MKSFFLKMLITTTFINTAGYTSDQIYDLGEKNPLYGQENNHSKKIDEDCLINNLDQATIDLGQDKSAQLDPFALGDAIILTK